MVYIPDQSEISDVPAYNSFFRAPRSESPLVSQISNAARKNAGIDDTRYIWKGIRAIAASPWNQSHIAYSDRGYENYNIEGPQYSKRYSLEPLAPPGSGSDYPVMWIPDPDNPLDPSAIFPPAPIDEVMPIPGGDPITWGPDEIEAPPGPITTPEEFLPVPVEPVTVREISEEVIQEIADPNREVIVIEPMTAEAQDIALSVPDLPTDKQADLIIEAAEIATDAQNILADPLATESEKKQAIEAIAELAESAGVDAAEIAVEKQEFLDALDAQADETTGPDATPIIETLPLTIIEGQVPKKSAAVPIVLLSYLGALIAD
jgi:hypothetical protein